MGKSVRASTRRPSKVPKAAPGPAACAHARERASQAPKALKEAEKACRDRGVRLTNIRRQVLEGFYETHRALGAYDIAEALTAETGRRVAPITVYRALEFLLEQKLIHRLVTRNAYVACPHGHDRHDMVAFLICEKCGGVDEASSPGVDVALSSMLEKGRFAPREKIVEIAGLCGHCQPRGAPDMARAAAGAS